MVKVGPLAEVTAKSQLPEVIASCATGVGVGVGVGVGLGVLDPPPHPDKATKRRVTANIKVKRMRYSLHKSMNSISSHSKGGAN
jgi:hypothetical protein